MKTVASIPVANIWANISTTFMIIGVVIAIAAMIWQPRSLPMCFVPLTVAFISKQGEARVLRATLRAKIGSTPIVTDQ